MSILYDSATALLQWTDARGKRHEERNVSPTRAIRFARQLHKQRRVK